MCGNIWIIFAILSAVFAALTSIFAKVGIKDVDSNLATAMRTTVVLVMAWMMTFIVGSYTDISSVSSETLVFLILSGLSTGA